MDITHRDHYYYVFASLAHIPLVVNWTMDMGLQSRRENETSRVSSKLFDV